MASRIPENILENILGRIDVAELISEYVPLKRAGRNFKAVCPFHHEKTPSFMVSPDRQIYHCFGCGVGGNAFNFLMQYEHIEFLEAVEILAKKAGITIPQEHKQDDKTSSFIMQLYKINELSNLFYIDNLNSNQGAVARNYLFKRGIKPETIKLFKIGYTFDQWEALINHLRSKGIGLSLMDKAGLVIAKEDGGYYDRFRDRIIFPVFDIKSRIVGFGARVLLAPSGSERDNALPKYINSPETAIYIKGRNLYGLNLSKEAIREADSAIIVEGYLDFITVYQNGISNAVASLGTALTFEQVRLIKRYTHNVVMIYDGDMSGQIAMLRTLDIFIEEGMNVKVVTLPEGFDPDSFLRKNGADNFKAKVNEASNLLDYKLTILKSRHNIKEIEGKAKICLEMLPTINRFKNAILKSEYIKRLAQELNVKEEALLQELKKIKEDKPYFNLQTTGHNKPSEINATEKLLIKLMLEERELISYIRERLEPADFQDERASRIVSLMFNLIEQGKNIEPNTLLSYLGDKDASQIICESTFLPEILSKDKEKTINDCVMRLKHKRLNLRKQRLHEEIKIAQEVGDEARLNRLVEQFHQLIKTR